MNNILWILLGIAGAFLGNYVVHLEIKYPRMHWLLFLSLHMSGVAFFLIGMVSWVVGTENLVNWNIWFIIYSYLIPMGITGIPLLYSRR